MIRTSIRSIYLSLFGILLISAIQAEDLRTGVRRLESSFFKPDKVLGNYDYEFLFTSHSYNERIFMLEGPTRNRQENLPDDFLEADVEELKVQIGPPLLGERVALLAVSQVPEEHQGGDCCVTLAERELSPMERRIWRLKMGKIYVSMPSGSIFFFNYNGNEEQGEEVEGIMQWQLRKPSGPPSNSPITLIEGEVPLTYRKVDDTWRASHVERLLNSIFKALVKPDFMTYFFPPNGATIKPDTTHSAIQFRATFSELVDTTYLQIQVLADGQDKTKDFTWSVEGSSINLSPVAEIEFLPGSQYKINLSQLAGQLEDDTDDVVYTFNIWGPHLLGDMNDDGRVSFEDFAIFKQFFGTGDPTADFDNNGRVDFVDFFILASNIDDATLDE